MATKRAGKATYPQLPQAPDDYPTFPDKSTWPVVFPALPPRTNGKFARPPQHTSKAAAPEIPAGQVPNHVAVVMDGNGRWATQRGLHRTEGHKMGEAVLIDITCGAIEIGIKHLTVYAFSTENWKRSAEEVRFLMGFNREVVRRRRENLNDMGVRMRWVGSRPRMWRSVIKEFDIAEQMTVDNDVITINYCVNYGGRTEIVEAVRELAQEAVDGKIKPGRITEAAFAKHLHRSDIPDVDLFIRTSGEQRASNFLLWQAAYAEYVFQDKLWPDYDRRDLWEACEEYVNRNRRFGQSRNDVPERQGVDGSPGSTGRHPRRDHAAAAGGRRRDHRAPRRHDRVAAGGRHRGGPGAGVAHPDPGVGPAVGRETADAGGRACAQNAAGHGVVGGQEWS